MGFQIAEVILWPRDLSMDARTIRLHVGKVNYIAGRARSGKTSMLHIIDYCLGSGHCSIPQDIRSKLVWAGVVVAWGSKRILFARRTPARNRNASKVYCILEDAFDQDAHRSEGTSRKRLPLPKENASLDEATTRLHNLSGHAGKNYPAVDGRGPLGFRDYSLVCFQPQHVIANPTTFFFGCEDPFKRDKLRQLLSGLLIPELLDERLDYLRSKRMEKEDENIEKKAVQILRTSNRDALRQLCVAAIDLGLLRRGSPPDDTWSTEYYLKVLNVAATRAEEHLGKIDYAAVTRALSKLDAAIRTLAISREGGRCVEAPKWHNLMDDVRNSVDDLERLTNIPVGTVLRGIEGVVRLAELMGSIKAYLRFGQTEEQLMRLGSRRRELEHYERYMEKEKMRALLLEGALRVNESINVYARELGVDVSAGRLLFVPDTLKFSLVNSGGAFSEVSSIGGSQNWLALHLALLLGLHEALNSKHVSTTPRFLILDQISQALFPDQQEGRSADEYERSLANLEIMYTTLEAFCEKQSNAFQIIVLDRFRPQRSSQSQIGMVCEEWFSSTGLVPCAWGI